MSATTIILVVFVSFIFHQMTETKKARREILHILWDSGDWIKPEELVQKCTSMGVQHYNLSGLLQPLIKKELVEIREFDLVEIGHYGETKIRKEIRIRFHQKASNEKKQT